MRKRRWTGLRIGRELFAIEGLVTEEIMRLGERRDERRNWDRRKEWED